MICGGIFDVEIKIKRLEELETNITNPAIWNDHAKLQKINKEKIFLEKELSGFRQLESQVNDGFVLLEMSQEEKDESTFEEVKLEAIALEKTAADLELKKLLSREMDVNNTYFSINSGAGGTEACDWAQMLLRMYLRYAEKQGYQTEIMDITEGEEAGIKSVTLLIQGPYAHGFLKAESGVHRLVRISPFDANARRHTSFTSVFAWPEIDDEIEIEIRPEDIRIDTYRASGSGGQHVNKTDSAVRITHIPTNTVIQCQNERSQHANKDRAFKMLKSALYEKELEKREQLKNDLNSTKMANEWGSQIRSYVMHPYQMVKDHRCGFETSNVGSVMDGEIQDLIIAYLKFASKSN